MRQPFASTGIASVILALSLGGCASPPPFTPTVPLPSPVPTLTATPTVALTPTTLPATEAPGPLLLQTPSRPVTLSMYSAWPPASVDGYYMGELIHRFKQQYAYVADVQVSTSLNSAQIGITIGDPPDVFYVNPGRELLTKWVTAGQMEPLDDVYSHYGLTQAFPPAVVDLFSSDNHLWSMPFSISRSNVLWYNRKIFAANDIRPEDLQTFSGWETAARKLQAGGMTPLAFGSTQPWVSWLLFESVLVGTLGPEKYAGLWNGTTDWRGPEVRQALQNFEMMLQYANPNHSRTDFEQAYSLFIRGQAAMFVMGDWMVGAFSNSGFAGYGWTTPPGTSGTFVLWPDGFSLPAHARHPEVAKEFLAYLGSRSTQEFFNRNRGLGAICARTDCDYSQFGSYNRASAADFQTGSLVPSIARAMSASEDWTTGFSGALRTFLQDRNLGTAQSDLDSACRATKICR